ncbi:MAG: LysR family transcriptional regulator [Paraburkholderia sp.]|jgi:DNA-binding transcriptional LysR family regulator|nr:LysR family transcriptional regulator [Paraburkholderia sp.]
MRNDDPLDSYLLRVLCTLVEERSVSRTAIRMNQSQPALSTALKRLRKLFGDPLLTREKNVMVPTERAMQLVQDAQVALSALDKMLCAEEAFDPERSERTFTIAMPDYLAPPFLADLVSRFRRSAPNSRLVTLPMGADYDYEKALAEGQVDIVIGNWPASPEHLHMSVLLEDEVVCLMAKDHPLARPGRLTAESYINASHLVPLPYSSSQRGVVESSLATLRLSRGRQVSCPYFSLAPYLVSDSDLILTTARHFAAYYARRLPLIIKPAPFDFPLMRFYALWHPNKHRAKAHIWLRGLIGESVTVLRNVAGGA